MRNLLIGLVVLGGMLTYVVLPIVLARMFFDGQDWIGLLPVVLALAWVVGWCVNGELKERAR